MLMDIYAKINKESIMIGRVLMDEDYHFEGVLNTENKMTVNFQLEFMLKENYLKKRDTKKNLKMFI